MTKDNHWCCICKKKKRPSASTVYVQSIYDAYITKICCNTSIAMKFLIVHS